MKRLTLVLPLVAIIPFLGSCTDAPSQARTSPDPAAESTPLPADHPPIDTPSSQAATLENSGPATNGLERGTALEVLHAGSYTYLQVESGENQIWLAGPRLTVEIGQEVVWSSAMPMNGWHSETLDRTWDEVLFVGRLELADSASPAGAHPGDEMPAGHPSIPSHPEAPSSSSEHVEIAPLAAGLRVAEIWGRGTALAGESVALRGRVVKANLGILGTNWYHVQDGSGDPATKTHDLTVCSQDNASVGDVIEIRGRLAADRDFGSGYHYDLIVEDASFIRE